MIDHRGAVNTVRRLNRRFGVGAGRPRAGAVVAQLRPVGLRHLRPARRRRRGGHARRRRCARSGALGASWSRARAVTVWNSVPALMEMLVEHWSRRRPARSPPAAAGDAERRLDPGRACRTASARAGPGRPGGQPGRRHRGVDLVDLLPDRRGRRRSGTASRTARPLREPDFHVLDQRPRAAARTGCTGELYIGGIGAGAGLLARRGEDRGAASSPIRETGERLYRTGDLGRLCRDGNIEFLGREDSQVKIQRPPHRAGRDRGVPADPPGGPRRAGALDPAGGAERPGGLRRRGERRGEPPVRAQRGARGAPAAGRRPARGGGTGAPPGSADAAGLEIFWEFWRRVERAGLRSLFETLRSLGVLDGGDVPAHQDRLVGAAA